MVTLRWENGAVTWAAASAGVAIPSPSGLSFEPVQPIVCVYARGQTKQLQKYNDDRLHDS